MAAPVAAHCWRRALCALCAAGCASLAWAQADSLRPGARISDCTSALRIGPVQCTAPEFVFGGQHVSMLPDGATVAADAALEAQVDETLRQYGKPPREAVRALLEPSDRNIERYLIKQQQMLAVVAYVAARMSSLQQASEAQKQPQAAAWPPDMAAYMQMRLTLVAQAGDPATPGAMAALRQLALQEPALQARVQFLDAPGPLDLQQEIARVPPPLTVVSAGIGPAPPDPDPPFIRIEDLRLAHTITLDARAITATDIKAGILALRAAARQENAALAPDPPPP